MKKMIVLIGLLMSVTTVASAGEVVKMPMLDYTPTPSMDYIYEIKTTKFDKVILDCQSLINGMDFSNGGVLKNHVPLDMFTCDDMLTFLSDSKTNNTPVCIGLDEENHELYMTHETADECK